MTPVVPLVSQLSLYITSHSRNAQCSMTVPHNTTHHTMMGSNIWRKIKKFKLRKLKKESNVNVNIIKFRKTIFQSVPDLLRLQMIKEKHNEDKEMISDYMEMTFKKRRKPEKTTNEYDQEYEIMSFVVFRGRKSEMPGIDEKNESVYEEYAC